MGGAELEEKEKKGLKEPKFFEFVAAKRYASQEKATSK
jgi:hypothetical protein